MDVLKEPKLGEEFQYQTMPGTKDLDFIMASFILTARFIKLEMFEQYLLLYMCKSHFKCCLLYTSPSPRDA